MKKKKKMKRMKRILAALAILMMVTLPVQAQVFVLSEEDQNRASGELSDYPFIPANGGYSNDQGYVPVGGGAALLAGFGAAYLLAKRKKQE